MKRLTGIVTKTGNAKTAYVTITSEWMHPKYLKKTKVTKRFACHDEVGVKTGDEVTIVECRQMSATKYFKIENVIKSTLIIEQPKKYKKSIKRVIKKA